MNTSTTPQWIDTEQVAAIYGIKKAMIERRRNCMVGGIKTGGLWRYNAAEIAEYVARTGRLFKPEAKAVPTPTTKPQKQTTIFFQSGTIPNINHFKTLP